MADEIGRAFQKVGGTSGALQIEFEKTASWIAVLSSRTREGAETIGQSIKSILARVQNMRENGFDEEDGTKINDVAKALSSVGIALVDSSGQFRNFGTVMDELGAAWGSLDSRTQAYLATTVAGTYQQSRFLNLMQGYADTIPLYEQSLKAAGTTQEKFNIYQESTEAAINRVKVAMGDMWSNTFNSEGMRNILDSTASLISGLSKLVDTFGSVNIAVLIVTASLLKFSSAGKSLVGASATMIPLLTSLNTRAEQLSTAYQRASKSTSMLGVSLGGLRMAMIATRVSAIALQTTLTLGLSLAITGIVAGLTTLYSKYQEQKEIQKQLEEQNKLIANSWSTQKETITGLLSEYTKLQEITKNGSVFSDIEQETRYQEIVTQLSDLMPNLVASIDDKGEKHLKNAEAIKEELLYAEKLAKLEQEKTVLDSTNNFDKSLKGYDELQERLAKKQASFNIKSNYDEKYKDKNYESDLKKLEIEILTIERQIATSGNAIRDNVKSTVEGILSLNKIELTDDISKKIEEMASNLDVKELSGSELTQKAYAIADFFKLLNSLKSSVGMAPDQSLSNYFYTAGEAIGLTKAQIQELITEQISLSQTQEETAKSTDKTTKTQEELSKRFDETISSLSTLSSAYNTLSEGEQLSADNLIDLIDKYPELASYLAQTNDLTFDKGEIIKKVAELDRQARVEEFQRSLDAIEVTRNELTAKQELYKEFFQKVLESNSAAVPFMLQVGRAEQKEIDEANAQVDTLKAKITALSQPLSFYSGGSNKPDKGKGDKPPKSEKSPAELAAEAREKAYDAEVDDIEHLAYMQDLNADEQIILWKKLSKNHAQYLKENEEAREDYDKQIKDLNKQSVEDSFNASKAFIEERKSLNQMSLSEEYDAWNRVQKKYKKDSKEWIEIEKEKYRVKKDLTQKLIDKAKELSDKEKDLDNDILSKQKEIRDHVSDMASEIIDIYKDVYETQKKILDAELSKYEEIYDARMKLIDDEEASEDYKRNLLKLQDEQMEIQKDLNVSILNDDVSNKKRREELEKALAEKTNEINDLKHDHEIDLRKESLQNDLDTKKKEVEAEKNHLDELINNDKKFAQIRQEVMSGVFTNVLADFAKFKVDIGEKSALIGESLSTNITDKISNMETQIATSSTLLQGIFAQLGIALEETFVKTLKDLITELEKLNGLKFDNFNQQIANTAEILALMKQNSADWIATTDKATRAQLAADTKVLGESIGLNIGKDGVWRDSTGASAYNQTAKQIVTNNDIVSQMKENSSAWSTASPEEQKKLADANQKLGEAQGWTRGADGIWRDKSGKKVYHTGGTVGGSSTPIGEALHSAFNLNKNEEMAKLLKKEVVINPANFKPRNFLQDILGSIKMPNFGGFNPAVAGGSVNNFNLSLNIENMNGTKKEANNFANIMVSELNRIGVKI